MILRRLDSVLRPTKEKVLKQLPVIESHDVSIKDAVLNRAAGFTFHNYSKYDFHKLIADPNNIALNLRNYINGFLANAREIIEYFEFDVQKYNLRNSLSFNSRTRNYSQVYRTGIISL